MLCTSRILLIGLIWSLAAGGLVFASTARAEPILHAFAGGSDGFSPGAGLTSDQAGNLYGTTAAGGGSGCLGQGCGTVFKLSRDGSETILYPFAGGSDGQDPEGQLVFDSDGNLYGTTSFGGSDDAGTIFKLTPDGAETVLHAFQNGRDGSVPQGNLVLDQDGNLYGTTVYGGNTPNCGGLGCGAVFKLAADGTETLLHVFKGGRDGAAPASGVTADQSGNLYGTAIAGGKGCDCGVVFKLALDGTETLLHTFQGGRDGMEPVGTLVADGAGNLFGVTEFGGGGGDNNCCGTVFRIAPDGTETVLYAFRGGSDAEEPAAGLVTDTKGNMYGTSWYGGNTTCTKDGLGCGTVFKVKPNGRESVLFGFRARHGTYPTAPLILLDNRLYGTTPYGGQWNGGVVFSAKK